MTTEVLDAFEDTSSWTAVASGLAQLTIAPERAAGRQAMRLDFDFKGGGGFVVARKVFSRSIPESYTLGFAVRGAAPANRFEIKLADPSGRNVWWRHWDAFEFPADWQTLNVRSSEIEFAWGPAGGGALSQLGAFEFVIAAGPGGAGTVWISGLRLEDRGCLRTRPLGLEPDRGRQRHGRGTTPQEQAVMLHGRLGWGHGVRGLHGVPVESRGQLLPGHAEVRVGMVRRDHPLVRELLSIRVSPVRLALPPVLA